MKFLLLIVLASLASADVSHIINQQQRTGYQYQNPAPQNSPSSSYGVPQGSVLGDTIQTISYNNPGSGTAHQLTLPSISGSSNGFNSGFLAPSGGISIQSYSGLSTPSPISTGQVGFQVSTPTPSVGLPSFQVSSQAPGIDVSGFQVSTPSSVPSVNLVYSQTPNNYQSSSYQFLSKLSQPSISVPSLNTAQFGVDTSAGSISSTSFGDSGHINSYSEQVDSGLRFGSGNTLIGKTSGGSLDESFGVVADGTGIESQSSEVSKHLYFFAAPEEEEDTVEAKYDLPAVPPKKTYKIIFIKAPTYRNQAQITVPAPPQNEEKTLVYVLVKKPEGKPTVRFQEAVPTKASKPEVFFIKYKTQKEAEAAVAEIQSKHGAAGQVIANLPAGVQPSTALQSEAAISSIAGISESSTPSTLRFNGDASVTLSQNGFSDTPFNSIGTNTFVSSTPATVNIESGIVNEGLSGSVVPQEENVSEVGSDISGLQFTVGTGLTQSPNPATFGQNTVDSLQALGENISPSQSSATISSSTNAASGGLTLGLETSVASDNQQGEANIQGQSVQNDEETQNLEGRIGADSENQGTQSQAGFSSYGPPNF